MLLKKIALFATVNHNHFFKLYLMKTKLSKLFFVVAAISALLFIGTSCSKDDAPEPTATFQLKLTDAPSFLYSEVNIDIQGIDVYVGNTMQGSAQVQDGWMKLNLQGAGKVNLIDLMHGEFKLLVNQEIPACNITKVRFNLGSDNSVKTNIGGIVSTLKTNGSFTFNVDWNVEAGKDYSFVVDIDASQSVNLSADLSVNFNPEPFIRTFVEAFGGAVSGYIHPATAVSYIEITNGTQKFYTIVDVIVGAIKGTDTGYFAFIALQPGDWTIKVHTKSSSGYVTKDVPVKVTAGQTFKIPDVIELSK